MLDDRDEVDVLDFSEVADIDEPVYRLTKSGDGETLVEEREKRTQRRVWFNTITGSIVAILLGLVGVVLFRSLFMTVAGLASGGSVVFRTVRETHRYPEVMATGITVAEAKQRYDIETPVLIDTDD